MPYERAIEQDLGTTRADRHGQLQPECGSGAVRGLERLAMTYRRAVVLRSAASEAASQRLDAAGVQASHVAAARRRSTAEYAHACLGCHFHRVTTPALGGHDIDQQSAERQLTERAIICACSLRPPEWPGTKPSAGWRGLIETRRIPIDASLR